MAGIFLREQPLWIHNMATKKNPYRKSKNAWNRDKVMDYICNEIANSAYGIATILRNCEFEMPDKRTVMGWLASNSEYDHQYAHAKELQADHLVDEIIEIADDSRNDYVERENSNGDTYTVFDNEHVQRSKLRIEARKWQAGKLRPKKYGEKIQHTGEGGGAIETHHVVELVSPKHDE